MPFCNVTIALEVRKSVGEAEKSCLTPVSTISPNSPGCQYPPGQAQALQEMKRVCHRGGRILLLEHGHSSMPWLANFQDRNVLPQMNSMSTLPGAKTGWIVDCEPC